MDITTVTLLEIDGDFFFGGRFFGGSCLVQGGDRGGRDKRKEMGKEGKERRYINLMTLF